MRRVEVKYKVERKTFQEKSERKLVGKNRDFRRKIRNFGKF